MLLSEFGVNKGVSKIGANGPDKPEDMAGIFGGFHLMPSLKKGDINKKTLCELLNSDSTGFFPGLDGFPGLKKHKDTLTKNSLNDMGAKYTKCKPCPDAAPKIPHSKMDKMLNPDGVGDLMNNQNWKAVFGDMNVNWPK